VASESGGWDGAWTGAGVSLSLSMNMIWDGQIDVFWGSIVVESEFWIESIRHFGTIMALKSTRVEALAVWILRHYC